MSKDLKQKKHLSNKISKQKRQDKRDRKKKLNYKKSKDRLAAKIREERLAKHKKAAADTFSKFAWQKKNIIIPENGGEVLNKMSFNRNAWQENG